MRDDRLHWERRYRARPADRSDVPSQFLQQQRHHIPAGPVLDVAAGDGRNSLYLARHGHPVDALDIAFAGLSRLIGVARSEQLAVQAAQIDFDDFPLPRSRYAAVVNIRFLHRGCFDGLVNALRPGGVLIFETFLIDQRTIGHPSNPNYLLQHGELAERLAGVEIISLAEGRFDTESDSAFLARAIARRPL